MTGRDRVPSYHSIGIGAGPANLSLAALYERVAPQRIALFEQADGPGWHSDMMHPGVRMQTSWLKDLVSLVDPTHRLSFLSYLVSTGRVYAFLNAQFDSIPRQEYVRYLAWASEQIADVHYGTPIDAIGFDDDRFTVHSGGRVVASSQHVVIAIGTRARMPEQFTGLDAGLVVRADRLSHHAARLAGDPHAQIAVVGGGQTGAECVLELLRRGHRDVWWFGRRPWFQTMEDSPSANDLYRPSFTEFLPTLPEADRRRMVSGHVLTSDGISPATIREIYQINYEAMLDTGHNPVTMLPGRDVVAARASRRGLTLTCEEPGGQATYEVRHAVVAAGREQAPLPFDERLSEMIDFDDVGQPVVESDYAVRWNGPAKHRIFAQNRAPSVHGLADKNLSLLAARSATIINHLFGREVYAMSDEFVTTLWDAGMQRAHAAARELAFLPEAAA